MKEEIIEFLKNKIFIKKYIIFFCCLILIFALIGYHFAYSSKNEPGYRIICTCMGIDKDNNNGNIKASLQLLVPSKNRDGTATPEIVKGEGETISSAIQNVELSIAKKIDLKNCTILVFGLDMATDGLINEATYLFFSGHISGGSSVLFSKTTAEEFLNKANAITQVNFNGLSNYIKYDKESRFVIVSTLHELLKYSYSESKIFLAPVVDGLNSGSTNILKPKIKEEEDNFIKINKKVLQNRKNRLEKIKLEEAETKEDAKEDTKQDSNDDKNAQGKETNSKKDANSEEDKKGSSANDAQKKDSSKKTTTSNFPELSPETSMAVLKEGKLIKFLTTEESCGLTWLDKNTRNGIIDIGTTKSVQLLSKSSHILTGFEKQTPLVQIVVNVKVKNIGKDSATKQEVYDTILKEINSSMKVSKQNNIDLFRVKNEFFKYHYNKYYKNKDILTKVKFLSKINVKIE